MQISELRGVSSAFSQRPQWCLARFCVETNGVRCLRRDGLETKNTSMRRGDEIFQMNALGDSLWHGYLPRWSHAASLNAPAPTQAGVKATGSAGQSEAGLDVSKAMGCQREDGIPITIPPLCYLLLGFGYRHTPTALLRDTFALWLSPIPPFCATLLILDLAFITDTLEYHRQPRAHRPLTRYIMTNLDLLLPFLSVLVSIIATASPHFPRASDSRIHCILGYSLCLSRRALCYWFRWPSWRRCSVSMTTQRTERRRWMAPTRRQRTVTATTRRPWGKRTGRCPGK